MVEGWHHAFQSSVSCHHPNIYKLIEHIQAEQDHTEQLIARFNAGNQTAVSSKNKYIQVTRRLTVLRLFWVRCLSKVAVVVPLNCA